MTMAAGTVLVDTSVWVDYLRSGRSREAEALDGLLSLGAAALCEPVKAELLSGALTRAGLEKLKSVLDQVPVLAAPADIWARIAEYRFLLARKGVQASLMDLWIVAVAKEHGAAVWTFDKDFIFIHKVIPFEIFDPVSSSAGMWKTNKKTADVHAFIRGLRQPRHEV
jgi:predicted nucleic acid-binding protein